MLNSILGQGQMLYAVYDKGKCYINDTRKCCKVINFEPEIIEGGRKHECCNTSNILELVKFSCCLIILYVQKRSIICHRAS